jgi:hypothetical protein
VVVADQDFLSIDGSSKDSRPFFATSLSVADERVMQEQDHDDVSEGARSRKAEVTLTLAHSLRNR